MYKKEPGLLFYSDPLLMTLQYALKSKSAPPEGSTPVTSQEEPLPRTQHLLTTAAPKTKFPAHETLGDKLYSNQGSIFRTEVHRIEV